MKIAPNLQFAVIEPTKKSLKDFVDMVRTVYQNFVQGFNGNIGFGDGTNLDNINGSWINVVAPGVANTDFTVNHNLNRIPSGYLVMQKDRACDIYTGSVAATVTQLTLRATVASAVLRLFVIGILLCLFSTRSEAQGANHTNTAQKNTVVAGSTGIGGGNVLQVIVGAVITVCNGSTLPAVGSICTGSANIFSNRALTTAISNPFNADNNGNYTFWASPGSYVVSVSGAGLTTYSYVITLSCNPADACNFTGNNNVSGISAPAITPSSINQKGLSSFSVDWARPTCSSGIVGYMASFSFQATATPTYNSITSSTTPCYEVALFSQALRDATRTDLIWSLNTVVQYTGPGSAQGYEADCNNYYQDYVIGGADTSTYSCVSIVNGVSPGFKGDRGLSINGPFQRGLQFSGTANRNIHFAGTPATFALYADQNQTNFIGGTWAWTNNASTNAIHRFTPFANDANAELFGTNAAANSTVWRINNDGSATFGAVTAPTIGPSAAQQHTLPAVASDTVAVLAATQTLTNKTLASPIINIGISQGSGFKHQRIASCTTGAAAGSTCTTTLTWTLAFADANYTAVCTIDNPTGVPYVLGTQSKVGASIVISIANLTAVAASGTLNCEGLHD